MFFDDLAVYEGFGGIVLARDEGLRIAEALGPVKKNVILQNHGYVNLKWLKPRCLTSL